MSDRTPEFIAHTDHTEEGHKILTVTYHGVSVGITRNPLFPESANLFVLFLPDGQWLSENAISVHDDDGNSVVMVLPIGRDQAEFLVSDVLCTDVDADMFTRVDQSVTWAFNNTF